MKRALTLTLIVVAGLLILPFYAIVSIILGRDAFELFEKK